jgi:hypothetical protein
LLFTVKIGVYVSLIDIMLRPAQKKNGIMSGANEVWDEGELKFEAWCSYVLAL